jgi:hypothetical protein
MRLSDAELVEIAAGAPRATSLASRLATELLELRAALREIAFLRPLGPTRNKLVEQMERIAINALDPNNPKIQRPQSPSGAHTMTEEPEEDEAFDAWIEALNEDVVQAEYGYEPGEFTVYPSHWWSLYNRGLTPSQAFKFALDAFDADRKSPQEPTP